MKKNTFRVSLIESKTENVMVVGHFYASNRLAAVRRFRAKYRNCMAWHRLNATCEIVTCLID